MDKIVAQINKIPLAHKLVFLLVVLAAMIAGYYYFGYKDQIREIDRLGLELKKLEDELHDKQEIAGNLSMFKKKVEFLQQKLQEKKKNLPDDANLDQLLKTLNELAEKSDMRIEKFTPMPEAPRQFYSEIPVKMSLKGNYHEIATFFDKIAKEDRIINISDITLTHPELKNGKIVLNVDCMAKTFKTLPVAATTAAAPGAAKAGATR
ncbi:MAG: type 4a pilus biogenesis protein PilO [Deltaproteobacteria bacterium]|nr:type 4a pilus biogenesis protein PilO [Deltaproteobacteria bacterium]